MEAGFFSAGLSDVLDMFLGNSEKNLHELFQTARKNAPCVLFLDEIDALGQKRSHLRHQAGRGVVNQLLAELDGDRWSNEGIFVLAASNHPWDVDTALRRPGRFDRMILVLPPDEPARNAILRHHLKGRPAEGVDVAWVAKKTPQFSGADLAHLCEAAAEFAMSDSISSGKVRSIDTQDFKRALKDVGSTVRSWFAVANNYALFGNEGGMYNDLLAYIRRHNLGD
jgi:SpoVK/Ycf46/Vps4 family AAA+-type ATPase